MSINCFPHELVRWTTSRKGAEFTIRSQRPQRPDRPLQTRDLEYVSENLTRLLVVESNGTSVALSFWLLLSLTVTQSSLVANVRS